MSDRKEPVYGPEDRIFPSLSDGDLWNSVLFLIQEAYPDRALPEHVREAFEAVCEESDDYMPFKSFHRKVRVRWLWKRPALPRGVVGFE